MSIKTIFALALVAPLFVACGSKAPEAPAAEGAPTEAGAAAEEAGDKAAEEGADADKAAEGEDKAAEGAEKAE
jgi:hypothetical protein